MQLSRYRLAKETAVHDGDNTRGTTARWPRHAPPTTRDQSYAPERPEPSSRMPMRTSPFMWAMIYLVCAAGPALAQTSRVVPQVVIEGRFGGAEGLAFNAEGRLFIAANRAVWEVQPDGSTRRLASFASNLGLAAAGARDLFFADFGPLVRPQDGPNSDGVIWRITPEGDTTRVADGLGDPNAIVVLPNGELLVSDDFTTTIYRVGRDGQVTVFTEQIPFPNGMVLSPDGQWLYVAQLFARAPTDPPPARFTEFSGAVWRLALRDSRPTGDATVIFRTPGAAGPDGLAMDEQGRIYLAAAREGQLWRIDPASGRGELLADSLPGLASLAFGRGAFDAYSLYATQIRGGRLLRFRLGVRGAPTVPIVVRPE